ncbi:MAG: hypothetical protein NTW19_00840 [Planctomycetota bacterium]|nr:hypothetical protein [Planctomycetota bacterium]
MSSPIDRSERWLKGLNALGMALFCLALLNFLAFSIETIAIGGNAISGKVEGDRHFVADHGKYTQVSSQVWHWNRVHAISVWITHPIGILVGGGLMAYVNRQSRKRESPA